MILKNKLIGSGALNDKIFQARIDQLKVSWDPHFQERARSRIKTSPLILNNPIDQALY